MVGEPAAALLEFIETGGIHLLRVAQRGHDHRAERQEFLVGQVGGADQLDIGTGEELPGRETHGVAALPDAVGALGREQFVDVEVALQLELRPLEERIAKRQRNSRRPAVELLAVGGIAGDVFFGHADHTHRAVLVLIGRDPEPRDVFKRLVAGKPLGIQVAMVVNDRQTGGVLVVETPGCGGVEEHVFVHNGSADLSAIRMGES